MPKVNVRIVGVYLGWSGTNSSPNITGPVVVDIDDPTPTVQQLLVEVAKMSFQGQIPGVSSFTFTPLQSVHPADLQRVMVNYSQPPKVGLDAGVYVLEDSVSNDVESVFQYYIYDHNFVQLNRNNEFNPFNMQPPVPIPNGGYVLIRQVAIATSPVSGNRAKRLANRYQAQIEAYSKN